MTHSDRQILTIATGQLGVFTRTQAHTVGLSSHQLSSRVQSGFLMKTGTNTYRVAGSVPTLESQLVEAALDIGGPVMWTGPTAAALERWDGWALRRPFHALVPRQRSVQRDGVVVHRTDALPLIDRSRVGPHVLTAPARTLIELARIETAEVLAATLDSALREGRVSEDLLHRRIVALRSQGRYGLPRLHAVLAGYEVTRGGHTWLEREYLKLVASAGLPRPDAQSVLSRAGDRLIRVDFRFPGTCVVVEALGYAWHRSRAQMKRDAERYNALLADGFLPYQFTYEQIVVSPAAVVNVTAAALRRAAA
jgi:hypothetical protein